jgi:hypothetical protein
MVAQSCSQTKAKRCSNLMQIKRVAGINQILQDRLGKRGVAQY